MPQGRRPRATALAGTICLVGLTALLAWQVWGSAGRAAAAAPKAPPSDALELLVRLRDLPLGYEVIDGTPEARVGGLMCDRVDPAGAQPKLDDFLTRNKPAGCLALLLRTYRITGSGPEPLVVGTGAMRLVSPEAAAEGLSVAPLLLSHILNDELPEEVQPPAIVGDASRLFHWRHGDLFSEEEETVTFLVWRSGPIDAAIFATGGTPAADDRAALDLAQRQQSRIEQPTAVTYADFDDSEVALENPALQVPVYWLGKTFDPGRGLPSMRLQASSSSTNRSPLTPRVALYYADHPSHSRWEALFVDAYSEQQWRQLRATGQPLPGTLACGATVRRLKIPDGSALVSHGREKVLRRCSGKGRRSWTVSVRMHGLHVVAETSEICATCAQAGRGPYDSFRGIAAVARGLALRERPSASP